MAAKVLCIVDRMRLVARGTGVLCKAYFSSWHDAHLVWWGALTGTPTISFSALTLQTLTGATT